VAQEKQQVFRTSKRRNPVTGATYPWLVPASGVVNQYYFYCVDEDFGPYADLWGPKTRATWPVPLEYSIEW
jgi:hypothetical protein